MYLHIVTVSIALIAIQDAPPADSPINTPPEGFTALFNGEDLSGWQGLAGPWHQVQQMEQQERTVQQMAANVRMSAHWTVEDGVLHFDGKGDSLQTKEQYTDFEMLVDWKIAEGGDSGIYLRGSPQVQIWDNETGSGGLYNNQKGESEPLVVADNPVGQWNTFRIRMIGETVSVWLNGHLVVDEVVLENYWDRSKPIFERGPIELQAHGSPLWFRNIYVRKIQSGHEGS